MTDATDKALDGLQKWAETYRYGNETGDGLVSPAELIATLRAERDALRAQLADAQAALDAAEIEHGITSNGNLWRFWAKKARDLAKGNTTLRAQLATARADAVRVKPLVWVNMRNETMFTAKVLGQDAYHVTKSGTYSYWGRDGEGWSEPCNTLEAAKAAAQADYEARILALIDTPSYDADVTPEGVAQIRAERGVDVSDPKWVKVATPSAPSPTAEGEI
jgi:hypothetical protein